MNPNIIIYDLEILKAIPDPRGGEPEVGIEYCEGWKDHANMGITVLGVYDYLEDRYRVFLDDNKEEFAKLLDSRGPLCVGFNSIPFDNEVLMHTEGWRAPNTAICYDLLKEIWNALKLQSAFNVGTHGGLGLEAMCEANFGTKKSGNGAMAPILWQRKQFGAVIDYCLNDVVLSKQLMDRVLAGHPLINPKGGKPLLLRNPV